MKTERILDLERLTLAFEGKKAGMLTRAAAWLARAKVPGGWLVTCGGTDGLSGVTFYPDPEHRWDGGSAN